MSPKRKNPSTEDDISGSRRSSKAAAVAIAVADEPMVPRPKAKRSSKAAAVAIAVADENEPALVSDEDEISGSRSKGKRSSKAVADELIVPRSRAKTVLVDSVNESAWVLEEPIADSEAKTNWPDRYQVIEEKKLVKQSKKKKKYDEEEEKIILARRHFRRATLDQCNTYCLNDNAHVQAGEGEKPFICRIVEIFEGFDGKLYFTGQWFYRAFDTVIKGHFGLIDEKRLFLSEIRDTNELDCLLNKLKILMIPLTENNEVTEDCDYYCDMHYRLPFSTIEALQPSQCITRDHRTDATLLDLYCGCGAMSTGLCMGAQLSGLKLVTKWAVDTNKYACESMNYNHPETEVRNESADDFLLLLKEWEKLCIHFSLIKHPDSEKYKNLYGMSSLEEAEDGSDESDDEDGGEVFEVEKIIGIKFEEGGLHLKVQWQNYGPSYDTWEPIEGLSNCRERIKEFVVHGYKTSILPLPGGVDVVCGGPPCQGVSGFNRFRNTEEPLEDNKNQQLLVYMKIVEYVKPKYILMENVVDMLKLAGGYLARYAVGRVVQMNYQTRMGMMAAGAYGLAQFRRRFFLWGALPSEKLPQFPLPTHDVVNRGNIPVMFDRNVVAYDKDDTVKLADKLLLADVITDLPVVTNDEKREEMPYDKDPETPFQQFIRLRKDELLASSKSSKSKSTKDMLYDHHPLNLNKYDYQRVCRIPKKKGANFRNLPGVTVGLDNKVEWDPNIPRVYLDPDNPLIPDYAMTYVNGTSTKPFGRLWWDDTVPTVIGRAEPHNHVIIHPNQDRVLTVRENARLQGFPDYYRLFGPTKEKYIQVGNAVAVPVARALGYALAQAFQGLTTGTDPLFTLPKGFPNIR